ncbi:MAG: cytochrome b N-terminal domain-containing protein [Planctomycetota bacterium]|jgi:ubiquinol-cytochrome c reductase cytochrome b subunit
MFRGLRDWLNDRTGYRDGLSRLQHRTVPEGPKWGYTPAVALLWLLVIECVTGFLLMATYSPSAQTAWASVHFIEQDTAGAFIRGIHYFAAQAMIILFGIHIIRVLWTAAFRAPLELVWATGLLLMPLVVIWAITGNPLSGTVIGMSQIEVEGNILGATPVIGPIMQRLLIGGSQVGHLTLTHLYFLHVALMPVLVLSLLAIHIWQIHRHGLSVSGKAPDGSKAVSYYPNQTMRNMIVLTMILGTIAYLAWRYGAPLEAPVDPQISHVPRPEWYFLFLFELREYFVGDAEIIATVIIPVAVLLALLLLPWLDRRLPRRVSAVFRTVILIGGCGAWSFLTLTSLSRDWKDQELLASKEKLHALSVRARELADYHSIPLEGPASLLRNDAKTRGPQLFKRYCASCHSHADASGNGIVAEHPSAPNLYGFGSQAWIAGLLDPEKIGGADYFGNTEFAEGDMYYTVVDAFDGLEGEDRETLTDQMRQIAVALAAEAAIPGHAVGDASDIENGVTLMTEELGCADCHKFGDAGDLGSAPDLTDYASRDWLIRFIGDPQHERFYGENNDRMPSFAPDPDDPKSGPLSPTVVALIADWMRGDWYEPESSDAVAAAEQPASAEPDTPAAAGDASADGS